MGALRPPASMPAFAAMGPAGEARHAPAVDLPCQAAASANLKILHVLRAPLGGLFRHVIDLTDGQIERGHQVGLIVDSTTGGVRAEAVLAELEPRLALGLQRVAIARELEISDIRALHAVSRRVAHLAPDVLHGHGAKGAALARLARNAPNAIRVYTPHGGSLVYGPGTLRGRFYRGLEWLLKWRTDLFLFESSYVADMYRSDIGAPRAMARVVRNGVRSAEFAPIMPVDDATDIVCVGELRPVKAIDVLIEALAILKRSGRRVSATIAGEGPDEAELKGLARRLNVADQMRFVGHCPARRAFSMGRTLVIPSRAESLPYIILEAAAAAMPTIATGVGGVPEIFGSQSIHLIAPDNVAALTAAIGTALDEPGRFRRVAQAVQARVRGEFSTTAMVEGGLAAYREAIAMRRLAQFT